MLYLYNYAGAPWKSQYWIRETMNRMYKPTPDGYCGDEDNGQTSAWYVFSALGFYPVTPAVNQYVVGAPLFQHATLHLENGKQVRINAPRNGAERRYIQAARLNGRPYSRNWLAHDELVKGATLDIDMTVVPNRQRAIAPDDAPYSFSREVRHGRAAR
jgi:predicted alpha-1,2-mannosidase